LDSAGTLLVLCAATASASKDIFVKLCYRHGVDPTTALALRMLLSLPFFAVAAAVDGLRGARPGVPGRMPLTARDVAAIAALGVLGFYLSSLFDFMGLAYISAALERLILFTYPTFVVILSAIFLRQRITRGVLVALLVSYGGMALVFAHDASGPSRDLWRGGALVALSTLTYSTYLMGSGALIARLGARRFTSLVMLVSSVAVFAQFALTRPLGALRVVPAVWLWASAMAVVATVMPVYLMSAGLQRIGAARTAMLSAVGPVITIVLGVIFLGESLTAVQAVGAALVIVGVWLSTPRRAQEPRQ
jgi:drug/metabolite transporter (DMT)-like permease